MEAGQGAGAQDETSLCVSGARTLGKWAQLLRGLTSRVSRVLTPAFWGWLFPFGRKLRRNRAGRRTRASLIPNTAIFFSRTLYCFNLLWGPRLQIDYYHVEGIWEGGLSFSVDPSDRPFLTTCVKNVPMLVTHSTQPLSSCPPYYSS